MTNSTHYTADDLAKTAQMPVVRDGDHGARSARRPNGRVSGRAYGTHDVDFIAHLIAHKNGYAQTRQKRRVSNLDAQNAYRATLATADKRMPVGYSKNIAA